MASTITCHNNTCGKELVETMQIEYSEEYGEYYCSLDCATESYIDRARNEILADNIDKEHHNDVAFVNGKLVYKDW